MAIALHNKLLTDISDELEKDSSEYDKFLFHMTHFVPKGLLNNKPTLLAKFGAMKSKGKLDVGDYENVKKVADLSGNIDILELITKREPEIKDALRAEKKLLGSNQSVSASTKSTYTESSSNPKKRKIDKETDHSDPLYGLDSNCRGKYDTSGKKGYLLILNNTYKRLGSKKDVDNLQLFFGDELRFEVDTISNDLSKDDVTSALEVAQEKIKKDVKRKYYVFVFAVLSHGKQNGLALNNNEVITIDEIREFFMDKESKMATDEKLAGPPKLFFIESCRGGKGQIIHQVDDADDIVQQDIVDMSDEILYIPSDADTLLAYSSTEGYPSFLESSGEASFIKALLDVFRQYYKTDHVEDMLISVREKIVREQQRIYDTDHSIDTKQMPCTQSTLTKRLYLTPSSE